MREWIVTNGLGGYASLTYQNTNTRKFHGLLVSSLNPPTERWVFVSNVFDQVQIDDRSYNLKDIRNDFSFDFFPSFTYKIEDAEIKKTVFMEYEKDTTILRYQVKTNKPLTMLHNPFINSRHFYDVNRQRYLAFRQYAFGDGICVRPNNIDKSLKIILHKDSTFQPLYYWEELFYEDDRERNEAWIDNNIHIGRFRKTINGPTEYYIIFTLEDKIDFTPSKIYESEVQRKKDLLEKSKLPKKFESLVLSSDNFIVKKGQGKSVIAGYHWFGEWGRDTLIALPGLTLVTGRFDDAKQILLSFSKYCRKGLIPNTFMDRDSKAVYNTVDASLWYIDRVYQYLKYTNDQKFLKEIWGTLQSIIDGYTNGTDFGIHMDDDFLISHDPGLTWMDVKIDNYYPTPRARKAIEIQALWYNALRIMSDLAQLSKKDDVYYDLSKKVKESFTNQFKKQYDVIDTKDTSLRPNQIFLISLDFTMINRTFQEKIINDIQENLLTIFGIRTLSPNNPGYKGTYLGDYNKDIAYHNGTVWPWLLGPYIKAFVKVKKYDQYWREYAYQNFLKPMLNIFGDDWDGSIYEIFDGDPIYVPRGCVSQAWSVAEILRAWVEDIQEILPKYEKIFESPKIRV